MPRAGTARAARRIGSPEPEPDHPAPPAGGGSQGAPGVHPPEPGHSPGPAPPGWPALDRAHRAPGCTTASAPARARRAILDHRLGQLLGALRRSEGYRALGFVRMADYAAERLGLGNRTVQELIRTAEALQDLPLAATAYLSGRITSGHLRLICRLVKESGRRTEAWWVHAATRLTVKELAAAAAAPEPSQAPETEDGPETERLTLRLPAWLASVWRDTVTHVRWVVGRMLPAGECLDLVLAEVQGTEPLTAPWETYLESTPAESASDGSTEKARPARIWRYVTRSGDRRKEEAPPPAPDARDLDAQIRRLVARRQRLQLDLAEEIHGVARSRTYRMAGHATLEAWSLALHGLSARRVYYLMALRRKLQRLPALRRAYLSGRLTLSRAHLVGDVATPATVRAWIGRAEAVTLRRLRDEVEYWRHLRDVRPAVWALLQARPLPANLVLVPGHEPRLAAPRVDGEAASRGGATQLQMSAPNAEAGSTPGRAGRDGLAAPGDGSDAAAAASGRLQMSARAPGAEVGARELLSALAEEEGAVPMPVRMCTLALRAERPVIQAWKARCADLQSRATEPLQPWEVLALVLKDYWATWETDESRVQQRRNPTLHRDGWRCTAPGCTSIGSGQLQEHHIIFRSAGGPLRDPRNLTTLCNAHHLGLVHGGQVRCRGEAPDRLAWELGAARGREPFLKFEGERRAGGTAA